MSSDIYISFGGDTSAVEAALAVFKAQIQAANRELAANARALNAAGAAADSEFGQKLKASVAKLDAARAGAAGMKTELAGLGAAAETSGAGIEISAGEMGHAIHGLLELMQGETGRAERGFTSLAVHLAAANPSLIGIGLAALSAAGALGYLAVQAVHSDEQIERLGAAAAAGGFSQIESKSVELRDEFARLSGESEASSTKILSSFAQMGEGGEQLGIALIPIAKSLAEATGTDLAAAMKTLEERYANLDGAGDKYLATQKSVLQSEREHYTSLLAAGQRGDAMIVVLRAMQAQYGLVATATTKAKAESDALGSSLVSMAGDSDAIIEPLQALKEGEEAAAKSAADMSAAIDGAASQVAALGNASAVTAAKLMADADKIANSLDRVGSESRKLGNDSATLLAGLNRAFATNDTAQIDEYSAAIKKLHEETLVNAQKGADPLGLDRDAMEQDEAALRHLENTWRGSQAGMKQAAVAFWQGASQAAGLDAATQASIAEKLEAAQKAAFDGAAKAGVRASKDELGAAMQGAEQQIQVAEKAARDKIEIYGLEAKGKSITEAAKLASTLSALSEEKKAVDAAYAAELAMAGQTADKLAGIRRQLTLFDLENIDKVKTAQAQAAEQAAQDWKSFTNTVNSAFTSQIDGLLTGTEKWGAAGKKVLTDLTEQAIKYFADQALLATENAAKNVVLGDIVVAANSTGNAEMAQSDASSAAAGLAADAVGAIRAILTGAAEAFAGVFGFLAPVMGPAAAGPAAGAYGAVAAMAGSVASADIGMWNVPRDQLTLIHHNELVMPAAQAGAFRGMLDNGGAGGGNVSVHPTTHYNITAMDSASVERVLLWNQGALMKTIDKAVRDGAHLGLGHLRH